MSTEFDSGNTPDSFKKEIIFDSSPPEISLKYTPSLFSPDSDGKNDILTISPKANDRFGVKEWNIVIYSPSGDPFKTFHGRFDPAEQIKWDGIGDDNQLVESAVEYYIEFSATDTTGNLSINKGIKLPIDVLVVVSEHGLKIMISNIEFIINSADLKGKEPPSLNRVATILKKYNNYNVLIEGHTCDQGDEDYNRKLSEDRSKAVMEYLISKGIESNRLTYKGIGEISPFLPNTNPDNRRRNRRVEFILIKK